MIHRVIVVLAATVAAAISLELPPDPATAAGANASSAPLVQGLTDERGVGGNADPLFSDVPEFVSTNNTQTVKVGASTVLSCQVNKLGSWQIIW